MFMCTSSGNKEFEVGTHLKLASDVDYLKGDNVDIVATDSQKNTVYLLANQHGVNTPEEFGLLLCRHFLHTYPHVLECSATVEMYPWERIKGSGQPERQHKHAFIFNPSAVRHCVVTQKKYETPVVRSCLKDLRVLKTTQSAFTGFVNDDYRSLPDAYDRIFSTIVTAAWEYKTLDGLDFDKAWDIVKDSIIRNFAGCPDKGIFSPSVQKTLYLAEKESLERVPQMSTIEMTMPNKHYFTFDFSKFPRSVVPRDNKEVFMPVDKPSGTIYAQLSRKDVMSKL
ncbi:LOW QUALITY PROTEIN: uricase-like [Ctenocephalides felis]|uniref:LOW QUALITY PROTEIN: uricase-like n=1 Tax=Ctenocephalides felis TaxID=7515 RepID=UPI000E6E44FE|nr:LOW QUALITY PROTEIN: uricase-like [Ctenocephalides felis]